MTRDEFNRLVRGRRLRDRRGRAWAITAEPVQEHGLGQVVMRSGDLVRRVNERFADDPHVRGLDIGGVDGRDRGRRRLQQGLPQDTPIRTYITGRSPSG